MSPVSEPTQSQSVTACFTVLADAEPGALPRLLGAVAKLGLTPARLVASLSEDGEELTLDLQVAGLAPGRAAIVGDTLRAMVGVRAALVGAKAPAARGPHAVRAA
ncbi:MAG: hypothetical protein RIB45_03120 [Marivibrio sp.]|uniref:hypothetical protein n=1 Tax=Marivibrio sp. TaxID=2039719 RepID=UPI0032EB9E47